MVQGNCRQRRRTRVSGMSSVSQGDGWVVQLCWALDRVSSQLGTGRQQPLHWKSPLLRFITSHKKKESECERRGERDIMCLAVIACDAFDSNK